MVSTDLAGLIEEAAAIVRPVVQTNGNTLAIEVAPDIGIATTDEPDLGALRVEPSSTTSFVTQRTVPFVTTFANLVSVVGVNGGPIEAGLVSASLALRPPQVALGPNIGFLRHDAALRSASTAAVSGAAEAGASQRHQ